MHWILRIIFTESFLKNDLVSPVMSTIIVLIMSDMAFGMFTTMILVMTEMRSGMTTIMVFVIVPIMTAMVPGMTTSPVAMRMITRNINIVIPVLSNEVDLLPTGAISMAVLTPVFPVAWGHAQINWLSHPAHWHWLNNDRCSIN